MEVEQDETLPIAEEADIVRARRKVRALSKAIGLDLISETKLITAASELARNTLEHGGGGTMQARVLHERTRVGVEVCFEDQGPGIADIEQALRPGFSTGRGFGLGLGGTRRLVHDFELRSTPGEGTWVRIRTWRRARRTRSSPTLRIP